MWLVLALDMIRTSLREMKRPIGPVVVLSYKNHALDEFVSDLVSFLLFVGQPTQFILVPALENFNIAPRLGGYHYDLLSIVLADQSLPRSPTWRLDPIGQTRRRLSSTVLRAEQSC